ncbi:uncharacterized protein [Cicer arietinum]|uniref:uncharacterized protein n=1 Tax=Cicer arietinum TaxID=3827 RepID=UPI003CC58C84
MELPISESFINQFMALNKLADNVETILLVLQFFIHVTTSNAIPGKLYRLPLLEIFGVTSTSLTFSVGFAYLEKERQDNFIWEFEKVRMLFKSESLISKVIVTDRDLAMMNAISVVFPTSIHLLCRFHIEKNVGARCKQYVKKDRQEEVMDLWKKIVYSTSVEEYDHHLQQFEILCADIILFVDYVKDSWLTPYKERFVNVWTNRVMHLGNTTSNRVESAHWRLKNMLQTSFGDLCKSWDAVNMMLKNQICIIQSSFQKTIKDVEHGYNSQFFQNLHHCVSRKCMKLIDNQLERVKIVGTNKTECGCSIRTTHGLPCACELAKLQINGNAIPLDSIHDFWKQLSIAHELEDEESLSDYDFSEELEAMKAYMKTHDIISQRIFKANVREVVFPHTTSILAPPEKVRTKGADVVVDGNCGFRAIAALLGWTEESWALVRPQLDKEIGLHKDVYSNVFYDNVESVRNSLKISKLDQIEV